MTKIFDKIKPPINHVHNDNDETIKYNIQDNWNIPEGWAWTKLGDISRINPGHQSKFSDDLMVTFLPMVAPG